MSSARACWCWMLLSLVPLSGSAAEPTAEARPQNFVAANAAAVQAALDALPPEGGCVRIGPGTIELTEPLRIHSEDVLFEGSGTATHLQNKNTEGQPAIDNFERDKPDLVLMDVQLPGAITGLEAVRMLRSKGYKTPIVAVTAYAMVGDREKCLAAGCDGYLSKPMPVPELIEIIKRYEPAAQKSAVEIPASKPEVAPAAVAQPVTPTSPAVVPAAATLTMPQPEVKPSDAPAAKTETADAKESVAITEAPTEPSNPTAPIKPSINGDGQKTIDTGQSVSPPVSSK